jgi:N-acetylmuramoyl-L-alanine amidase
VEFTANSSDTLRLNPWFGGVLLGKRFVLDPQGGPPAKTGVGSMGLSGAYVNLRVAVYLEAFLRAAGAGVRLTRTSEEVRLPEDIARMTNRYRADRYLELRHPSSAHDTTPAVGAFFFPGSVTGEAMARTLGSALADELGVPLRGPTATVTYALQQTACPAIVVAAPSIGDPAEELRLDSSAYLRQQAYGIFLGILEHYDVSRSARLDITVADPVPAGWMVTLDDTWTLVTGPNGRVRCSALAPGEHRILARRGDTTFRETIVVTSADASMTLPVVR